MDEILSLPNSIWLDFKKKLINVESFLVDDSVGKNISQKPFNSSKLSTRVLVPLQGNKKRIDDRTNIIAHFTNGIEVR